MTSLDLVLRGGRVVDPSQSVDAVMDVGFRDGRVAALAPWLDGQAIHDVSGKIVTPGLIDLHTHVYWGGASLSVDPMALARRGCTTLVDTGTAGAGNFDGFRRHVIETCPARIVAYLNISFAGIYAFSKRVMVGESGDQRLLSPLDTLEVADANRDVLAGLKVRVGQNASGTSGIVPLEIARQTADKLDMRMMVHIDVPPPTLEQVLGLMRPGDVLTHCFRPFPNSPVTRDDHVLPAVIEARERGVLFDIGHGMGSFSFEVARVMLANGFAPDTISSDVHALCIEGPAFDLTTTLSKFLCLGMPLADVIRRATINAAKAIERPELGSLKPGMIGDASILSLKRGSFDYVDSTGVTLKGDQRIDAEGVVIGGRLLDQKPTALAAE
ncbi:amidohydrolase/deacetylase family metallohydrolase [Terrarubrum flagellatum]|uniref:amidohydrolase/deacetylase family metallohydrolase n=1 Tax=Terrirubrum flagellatum TaxID=2895980 RepID=UPI003144FE47